MHLKFDDSKLRLFSRHTMDDCLVISVSVSENTIVECPLCGDCIKDKEFKKSCLKSNKSHNVCISCYNSLSETYYKDGKGCLYCGDPRTINKDSNTVDINFNDVIPRNNIIVIQNNERTVIRELTITDMIGYICVPVLTLTLLLAIYCFGNLIFSIGVIINHNIKGEDHHHSMNFSIKNSIIGIFGWLVLGYIFATTVLLCDTIYVKCIKKLVTYPKNHCVKFFR